MQSLMELYISQNSNTQNAAPASQETSCKVCNYQDNYYGDQMCRVKKQIG